MLTAPSMTRRTVIAASLALVAASGIAATGGGPHRPKPAPAAASTEPSNRWLEGLKAPHRRFFDSPSPNGGIPLVHVMNYYDTYNKAFGVKDADINAVLTFYGATTFYGLNDAVWAKYRLGEFLDANDPATGKPVTRNPWRAAPVILGLTLPAARADAAR